MALTFPTIDGQLRTFFKWYGNYLVEYWYLFITFPLLLTLVLSTGFLRLYHFRELDIKYLYTPDNALSWYEEQVIHYHWPVIYDKYLPNLATCKRWTSVLATSTCMEADFSDSCNILHPHLLEEMIKLDNYITQNISIFSSNGTEFYYKDLCLGWGKCYAMGDQEGLLTILQRKEFFEKRGVIISYPRANTGGNPIYLAFNLGGVRTHPENGSIYSIAAIRTFQLLRSDTPELQRMAIAFEDAVEKFMTTYHSNLMNTTFFHSRSVDNGMNENAQKLMPKFPIAAVVLLAMTTLCMLQFQKGSCKLNLIKSKSFLAPAGLVTASMGILSGFGLFLLFGIRWSDINVVLPFLIISIGIDDMFIMVAAWDNSDGSLTVRKRMQNTLSNAAVAITITSLTDALSFAVGCVTTIPSVRSFCMTAAICVIFDYFYQITFFAGIMVVAGCWEDDGRIGFAPCLYATAAPQTTKDIELKEKDTNLNNGCTKNIQNTNHRQESTISTTFLKNIVGPALLNPVTKISVLILFVAYLSGAVWGCVNMQEGLEFDKLMLSTNPAVPYIVADRKYMRIGGQVEVVINDAPSMVLHENRAAMENIVAHFENSKSAIGKQGTQFWLRDYIKFQEWGGTKVRVIHCNDSDYMGHEESPFEDFDDIFGSEVDFSIGNAIQESCLNESEQLEFIDTRKLWIDDVYSWTKRYSFQKLWSQDVVWKNANKNDRSMPTFRFRIGLKDFLDSRASRDVVRSMRRISKLYDQFNVTTYQYLRHVADQMDTVLPNTLRNIAIVIGCMIVISLIFIPNPICTLFITLAIISIDLGVIGYMTWWKVNLDPNSMTTIIMSIGFSVDFTAHITYSYVSSPAHFTTEQKVVRSLERLAWPVFQGAISTVLGVTVLAFIDSYMVVLFFKTVFLVILFATVHALIFLPVLLSTCMPLVEKICNCTSKTITV